MNSSHLGPIIHLIRHAEAKHKLTGTSTVDTRMIDPRLTKAGIKHCIARRDCIRATTDRITHILCSPLARAVQTTKFLLREPMKRGVKAIVVLELQSMGYGPNAQGRGLEAWFRSKTVFEPYGFDYHLMHDDWNDWEDTSPEGLGECAERLGVMRGMIRDLSGEVAIVSHSSVVSAFGGINNYRTSARDEPGISSYRLNTVGRLQPISEDELELHREQYDDINREYQDSTMGDNGSENSNANNSDLEEGSDDNQADDSDKSSVVSRLEVDRSESDLEDLDESSDDGDADKSGVDVDDSQSSVCTNEESDLETTAETEEMEVDENDGQCSVHPEEESCSEEFDENERMDGDADASQMSDCSDEESDSGEEVEMVKKSVRGRMTGLPERFFSISTSKSTYAASRRN